MEVRAHSHTERKKWIHYLWEFLMLFLAVFCGFLAENQREHLVERKRAVKFAKQLVSGLGNDTLFQKQVLTRLEKKEKRFDSLLYYLAMPADNEKKWIGIYRNMHDLELRLRYTTGKAKLDQIKNSGSLRYFTNDSLLSLLAEYETLDFLQEQQTDAEFTYISQTVTPFIIRHFDKNFLNNRSKTHIMKPGWDSTMIGNTIPAGFTDDIKLWKREFENIVITAKELHTPPAFNLHALQVTAKQLISILKKEYNLE